MPQATRKHSAPKKSSKPSRRKGSAWKAMLVCVLLLAGLYMYLRYKVSPTQSISPLTELWAIRQTNQNYGHQIDSLAKEMNLPAPYFKALVVLECSGRKEFKPRYEAHVYNHLLAVRDRKEDHYYHIKYKHLSEASNEGLKNLSTSWGPFQLMGYQCINMGITIQDLRGDNALYWGMRWIEKRYGKAIRKGQFADAFHIHNTGRPHPAGQSLTHDPEYVKHGLLYMKHFEEVDNDKTE